MTSTPKKKSILYVLICVFLWALIPVVSKLGQSNLDNHQFLFWSSLFSLLTFLLIIVIQKKGALFIRLSTRNWFLSVVLGFLGSYLYYILLYFGYAHATGIEVLIIQYCWPIFVVVLSIVIVKEKLNTRKVISIILGFFGVFLVLTKGKLTDIHLDNFFVDAIVLFAAFIFGLFSVWSKKIHIDSLLLVTIYFFTATVASFFSMIVFSSFTLPTRETYLPILINGLFVNGISYLFWIAALKNGKASFIAPFVFLTPIISTVLLIIFFSEPFHALYALGMISVVLGGLINKE